MSKILITGAKGFIGSHLGNRLVELGHEEYFDKNYQQLDLSSLP